MKVYVTDPEGGIDKLSLIDRDIPSPGAGEILVRMKANSVNYRDLTSIRLGAARGLTTPRIPNSDGAGIVEAIGAGITKFAVGDRVVGCFFQNWIDGPIRAHNQPSALGGPIDGVLAEYAILKEDGTLSIPDNLSFDEAATLPCAAVTAWNCLIEKGEGRAGDTALLLGTGGVSIFALQFAKMTGMKVIMTSSSDEKLARVSEMGADETINYRNTPDWEKAVLELTSGEGVDVVVEVGGAGTLQKSIEAVRVGGRISLVGILAGGTIEPTAIMRKSVRLEGIYVGPQAMFGKMNRAIAQNKLRPVIDKSFTFDNAPAAYRYMEAAGHFGKIVITFP
jgi:NADPH:quinone reductase-like Zn-dependent oxidoreductase